MCRTYHVLPSVGGLLDQDWFFVFLAMEYETAKSERAALDAKRNAPKARK